MRYSMKPSFHSVDAATSIVRIVNDEDIAVGTVTREETTLHTPERPSYRYIIEMLGKYQARFGGIDHVVGFLEAVSVVHTVDAMQPKKTLADRPRLAPGLRG